MSATARWSYTNSATIWRQGPRDPVTREPTWEAPIVIDCTFESDGKLQTTDNGEQFTPNHTVYHEDARKIGSGDRILVGEVSDAATPPENSEVIQRTGMFDMSFFGEDPDFVIYTGQTTQASF